MHIENFHSYSLFKQKYATHDRAPFFNIALNFARQIGKVNPVIVDIGSGEGDFFQYLQRNNFDTGSLFLLDSNPATVESNKSRLTPNSIPYTAPDRLPFDNNSVGLVHTSHMIEYLSPDKLYDLMKEMDRVLTDGGYMVISAPLHWDNFYNDLGHLRPYNPMVFHKYLIAMVENNRVSKVSDRYELEQLVYRYHQAPLDEGWSSSTPFIDSILITIRRVLGKLGFPENVPQRVHDGVKKEHGQINCKQRKFTQMASKEKINFAIIGCGRIAQRHAEHINNKGVLAAVCDTVREKADQMAQKYGARAYYSVEDLLAAEKDVEVVAVCSPNGLHAEHSIKALNAGFHVLCEKPMAITVADCGKMIQAAEKSNRRLFAIKQNRYNPPIAALKQLVDEDRLGDILSVQLSCFWNRNADYYHDSWKGTLKLDGGTLFTQFSHFIDLLYWIVGDVDQVQAYTGNLNHQGTIEFEDTGVVIVKFTSGAIGTINYTVNSYGKNMEGSLTIFGKKGTVKVGGQYLNELEYQQIEGYKIENLPEGGKANNYGSYQGSMSNHDKVYDNLIEVLQNNAPISTSSFEGLKTVEIIEKIYKSAARP
jgi:UDP-N-acetyl-2-amino-2-deoxyglucuronate dehydrogenase